MHRPDFFWDEFPKIFKTKKGYNKAVINAWKENPKIFRITIMGPHFLHPQWVIEERLRLEPDRESFSQALREYLERSFDKPERNIKIFIRNSPRYFYYLNETLAQVQLEDFSEKLMKEMNENLDVLFPSERNVKFCCADPGGYFYNLAITDKYYFRHKRKTEITSIEEGRQEMFSEKTEQELKIFDEVFDNEYQGFRTEKCILRNN